MLEQAVLLARFHHPASPSQGTHFYPSDILCRTPPYSGGTAPAYTGFSIKSDKQTPVRTLFYLVLFYIQLVLSFVIAFLIVKKVSNNKYNFDGSEITVNSDRR